MKFISTIILFLIVTVSVQAQGIKFQAGTLPEALKLAAQQDKLLFIDFYTQWCGPCKMLDQNVFVKPEVGGYFNREFICFKLDAEKEGKELAKKLGVYAYPTLIFLDSESEVVCKHASSISVENLLEMGKKAKAMKNDPNRYSNLKKMYPTHRQDEKFLANYIVRMKEFSESPKQAIEDYLKIQRSVKENYAEMMEFLIENSKYLICGGKAEEIFLHNQDEYLDIATRSERKKLERIYMTMINNTYRRAVAGGNVALYEIFIDRWQKLPEKPYYSDYNAYRLELVSLKKEKELYVSMAEGYLDSLTNTRTAADIHTKDSIHFVRYCEENKQGFGMFAQAAKMANKDLDAHILVNNLVKAGNLYLDWSKGKKAYKNMNRWVDFGQQLLPEDQGLNNLEIALLLKQGKKKEAIAAKEKMLESMSPEDRNYTALKTELEKMKNEE